MAPTRTARPSREDGFGLIEMIIVLVILSILMAVAIPMFRGSKQTAAKKAAITAAGAYSQALSRYSVDYAGRYPTGFGPATGWPAGNAALKGPVDLRTGTPRPYLSGSQTPENVVLASAATRGVQNSVVLATDGSGARSADGYAITYESAAVAGKPEYRLTVWEKKGAAAPRRVCTYGNFVNAGTPPC